MRENLSWLISNRYKELVQMKAVLDGVNHSLFIYSKRYKGDDHNAIWQYHIALKDPLGNVEVLTQPKNHPSGNDFYENRAPALRKIENLLRVKFASIDIRANMHDAVYGPGEPYPKPTVSLLRNHRAEMFLNQIMDLKNGYITETLRDLKTGDDEEVNSSTVESFASNKLMDDSKYLPAEIKFIQFAQDPVFARAYANEKKLNMLMPADMTAKTCSYLDIVVQHHEIKSLHALLEFGKVDLESRDKLGFTLAGMASKHGRQDVISMLLDADVDFKNGDGNSSHCAELAKKHDHEEVAVMINAHEAKKVATQSAIDIRQELLQHSKI